MRGITWTKELTDRLKTIYDTGISSSQIAAEMNCGVSRNAVIGKVHRMGFARSNGHENRTPAGRARRHQPYKPREKRTSLRIVRSNSNSNSMRVVETVEFGMQEMRCVEVEPRHLSLIDLEPNDCRWPYGDSPFTHCGHPQLDGSSYCAAHYMTSIKPLHGGQGREESVAKLCALKKASLPAILSLNREVEIEGSSSI